MFETNNPRRTELFEAKGQLFDDLRDAMNIHRVNNDLDVPDYVLAGYLIDQLNELLSRNVTRICRAGHKYVTDSRAPGRCWCGVPARLDLVPG